MSSSRRRRSLRTALLALPAAFGLTMVAATSANAHYVYWTEQVWGNADSSRCLWNRAETSHGSTGGGYFKGDSTSYADIDPNPLDCVLSWDRNSGELAEGMIVFKWYVDANGDGSWLICDRTDQWYFNSEPAWKFELTWTAPAEGLCGAGYYGIRNYAGMVDSGEWVGLNANVWSGYHLLPDTSSLAATAEDEPVVPDWLKNTDTSDDPASVPVIGENGEPVRNSDGSLFTVSPNLPEPTAAAIATAAQDPAGERTFTKDADGSVTETVAGQLTRPAP
ncbi:hypothetical protein QQY66_23745 [Streptomyces sp. DG2A-72]|uniref:hypothetical protein n=1 Tax=Streptomyces sp. DG2A-72 TaxID=3051386 RepID=UPI00265BC0DF|nr:hypothetical protein [Streptomyces sp. DG2A-72]MDO0934544.1 hypothetical protein [Streptomyces sp. DG2A-72]